MSNKLLNFLLKLKFERKFAQNQLFHVYFSDMLRNGDVMDKKAQLREKRCCILC
ncbi:hypothetical protein [Oceanimonas sp. MB9]|uniref:hypothetical protein n=1 Tax=Oceanimonas sp. MB9 TaxID=2588453 RepID=UPI0013F68B54|nr:hypothetical protein [Oceanimonas sp. MB9]NHI01884.1 hypothetical protein [Oceanimonas sp. MB9]